MAADVTVSNHGSIVMVFPHSEAAHDWVEANVPTEDWQWMGGGFACEPRYVANLVHGMTEAGLEVLIG